MKENSLFEQWKYRRYGILAAGVLIMLLIGIPYAWSVFSAPVSAAFPDVKQGPLQFTFTVFMIAYGIFGIAGGYVISFFRSARISMALAGVLIFLGFLVSSNATALWQLYLGFGLLGGTGVVFAYNAVIVTVTRWFPDRTGTVIGLLMMGYGLGSFLIGSVFTSVITGGAEWRTVFRVFGIVIGAVVLAGTAVMGFPPEGYDPPVSPPPADRHPIETLECAPGEMIRRKSFWLLYAMGTCTMMAGMGVISSARSLVLSIAPDAALGTVAFMAGILSVASAAGRVFTGFLNDIVGVRANIRISSVAITAATLLVMCAVMSGNLPFLAVSFALCGFSCGMCIPAAAVVTAKLFGARHYQVNLEIVMSCGILHAFAATFVGAMYDAAGTYVLPVLVLALTGFLGAVCSFRIRKP